MLFFVIDDEAILLDEATRILQRVAKDATLRGFKRAHALLAAIREEKQAPDVVFCDIELPDMHGLDLAKAIKEACPETKLFFLTAYEKYAVEAYRMHADGYIMKPLRESRVREELTRLFPVEDAPEKKLRIRCFGDFAAFWGRDGSPVIFARRKTKEMLAYIVDKNGRMCSAEELGVILWEDESDQKKLKTRIRSLIWDLKHTFEAAGAENLIIRKSGLIGIVRDGVYCDYFRFLDGDAEVQNEFKGEYMNQYSWAEETLGKLSFASSHSQGETL